jgi:uncharacterized protein YcnI
MFRQLLLGAVAAMFCFGTALAHVTLETQQAAVGASYKAVLRVPHGCDGSATTAIRVRLPAGITGVKPMPKPGWKLDIVSGKYAKPLTWRGTKLSEGVTEIAWSGGNLADAFYDEFVFTSVLAEELEAGQMLYFPVVQECEKGVHRWIEIPTGHSGHDDHSGGPEPAPGLKLLPKQ